jgi:hypothetical protein
MVARLDGRSFTRLTKEIHQFEAPFDARFRDMMLATAEHLMAGCGFNFVYGYTQSDEISLLFALDENAFQRKLRKLHSVLSGEASAKFSLLLGAVAVFDCRISQLPTVELVIDYFRWRNEDAHRNALVREFTTAWEAAGGSIANNVSYNPEAPSLNSEAGQIASGDPDAWMIIDYPESWDKMGPALVRTGQWDPARTFTGDGLRNADLPKSAGRPATEGMRGTAATSRDAPAGAAFEALWTKETGEPAGTYTSNNFDAVIMIALAAAAAGSSDPADIAAQLPAISKDGTKYTFENLQAAFEALQNGEDIDYEGASGPLNFDDNGDPTASNYGTWEYTGGKLVDTDQVISFGAAEAEVDEDTGAETSGN